ncbi:MAG: Holliday junction branch migration protein RuvA [Puniceicoccales bacterium]|jgi:Holliday junction DNA helicase RuvA|nr:Holliday junction branch migration protein RuvA [Puniceicoccales bacterium]
MIVSLRGTLIESGLFRAVVECAGVGYEVSIPLTTAEKLPPLGGETRLHTLQVFREDNQSLYGFCDAAERDFFRLLIEKVSGIGPKTALNIFSRLSLAVLRDAIATSNTKLLSDCPGIGKKTAERLIIELRDKTFPAVAGGGGTGAASSLGAAGNAAAGDTAATATAAAQTDAVAALVSLGFKLPDADKAVRAALAKLADASSSGSGNSASSTTITPEKLIRAALGN